MTKTAYVVTFDPRPVSGPGAIAGLQRMTLDQARETLTIAARIPKRGRIIDAATLSEVDPVTGQLAGFDRGN